MIGEWMTEITAFAQQLVQVNSLSGFEGDVAAIIQRKMQELDFDQVTVDEMGNVIASKKESHDGPVILFDGHIDVVEVPNPEKWTFDPFSGKIVDGKLYGRGAQDMKGPLAAILITLGRIPRSEFSGTMVLSCSVHEEKHEGAALKHVVQRVNPDLVVICEPNGGTLGLGQKGRAGITVDVPGRPAHSSVPHLGENAIYRATDVIRSLREMQLPEDEHLGKGVMELIDGISRPYPSRSTIPVGFFMHYDRRIMPFETRESVLSSIQDLLGSDEIKTAFQEIELPCYTGKVVKMDDFHPGWKMPEDSEWAVRAKSGLKSAGLPVEISYAQFCTNGSYSAGEAGIPTIIFGPSSGMLAHCQDEYISLDELETGARGYAGLIKTLGN